MHDERDLSIHQRGLVDTCFEEGQYESAIAALDQLRASFLKPPADHIRQLLYIALFPPPTGDQVIQRELALPPSPLNRSPSKQTSLSKTSLSPSVADTESAQRVLFSFLATNSPAALFSALPRYKLDDNDILTDNSHDDDSVIAQESLCIRDCRDCWAILKDGFIQRKILLPRDAKKKRGRAAYDDQDALLNQASLAVVAEHAWPILQWLLSLFEKDELLNSQTSGDTFSPLFLSQIPPPRGRTGPRWEAGDPLNIVFHALDQNDAERRNMATRLLALLINLTFSASFDGPMFVATLTTRLYTSSPQIVQNLMESLPKTIPILTFKLNVCQRFLSSSQSVNGGTKPRPKLARRGGRPDSGTMLTDTDVGRAVPSRPALLTCADIFQLLCDHKSSSTEGPPISTIKYSLFMSYAHLQGLLPPEERDFAWKDALSNGRLRHVIDTAFLADSTYHKALIIITSFWQAV